LQEGGNIRNEGGVAPGFPALEQVRLSRPIARNAARHRPDNRLNFAFIIKANSRSFLGGQDAQIRVSPFKLCIKNRSFTELRAHF
jgi:hypothetical protein